MIQDGLYNLTAQIATDRDKASGNSWSVYQRSNAELEAMYRGGWIGRKIIDVPCDDMTRKWREWSADDELIRKIDEAEKRFAVRAKVAEAKRWARLYGSSAIIVGVKPHLGRPEEPLDYARVSVDDLIYLHVEFAPYLTIRSWNTDLTSPDFGKPEIFRYTPFRHGGSSTGGNNASTVAVEIHASRVITFAGMALPPIASLQSNRWGDSVFTAIEQTLNTAGSITPVIASLVLEAKTDIIKIPDLMTYLSTSDGEKRLKDRFSLAMMMKSINQTLLLGGAEEFDQKQLNFSGLSDIHMRIMQEISGAADIPVTRLLGQAPAGLQSTGEADLRNYYDHISARQEAELRPQLERIDALMFAANGITLPKGASFKFAPLWQETPEQLATNGLKKAQATKVYVDTGLIDDSVMTEAVVSQLVQDGVYPGLEAAVKQALAEGREIEGDHEEDMTATPDEGDA